MKAICTVLLPAIAFLILLNSCNDINGMGDSMSRDIVGSTLTAKDTLGFLNLTPINLDTIVKGRYREQFVFYKNISDTITVIIYSVQFKNNVGFEFKPAAGFPVTILPKHDNSNNWFDAKLNTDLVAPGYYKDTIYFNGLTKFYTTIEATVLP